MANIKIWKKNESVALVDCDPGIAQGLSEYFSFFVPGYKYMKLYKRKIWDGKIRLFNVNSHELPAGLYPFVEEFCKRNNYSLLAKSSDYGSLLDNEEQDAKVIYEYVKDLNLTRCVLLSPTGSGKSLIIYCLSQIWLKYITQGVRYPHAGKVLVVVPTTSLVEQMQKDFVDYGMGERGIHKIYSGKDKDNIDSSIVISTWQSIYKLPQEWFNQFGMVIGDECHGFKSKSLMTIMNKCSEAEFRFGTTGTLDGAQTHELVLQGLFGKVYRVTTTKSLQDSDTLAQLKIKRIILDYPEEICEEFGKRTYQEEIEYIVSNSKRNSFIRNLALDQTGNTLVLYNYVEKHGKPLFNLIEDKADENRKVFFVSGNVDTADREAIRGIVEKSKNAIIVASLGTFSTGINIRNLHNIVFASPSKSQIRVLQSIGRGLRKSDNNEATTLYDISNDISWLQRKNYSLLHSFERLKMYQKEQFEYKTIQLDIKS